MRIFKANYRDRKGRKRESAKWYVEFTDHLQTVRRLAGFTDRKATEGLGHKLERLVSYRAAKQPLDVELTHWVEAIRPRMREKLSAIGLLDSRRAAASKSLLAHLADFERALRARAVTEQHVRLTVARVRTILKGCSFKFWSDIRAGKVQDFLAGLRAGGNGISKASSNYYLREFKCFSNWLVEDRRASESPVAYLKGLNAKTDIRVKRRALTTDECRRLLQAARDGGTANGVLGPDRALLYEVALATGLRANELRNLTVGDFNFSHEQQTVTVRAESSKHRREDTLPLRPDVARAIKAHVALKLPGARVFKVPRRTAEMLRVDLEAAGIPYRDEEGRVLDFHGLRHSFITALANSGVHPSVAQALARHSTIGLTMNTYTHVLLGDQVEALAGLPDLSKPVEEREAAVATGTDDRNCLGGMLAVSTPTEGSTLKQNETPGRGVRVTTKGSKKPAKQGFSSPKEVARPGGFEPPTYGLEVRCSVR